MERRTLLRGTCADSIDFRSEGTPQRGVVLKPVLRSYDSGICRHLLAARIKGDDCRDGDGNNAFHADASHLNLPLCPHYTTNVL